MGVVFPASLLSTPFSIFPNLPHGNAQPRLLRAVLALGCALEEGVAIGVSDPNPEAKRSSIASKGKPKTQSPTRKAKGKVEKWELELDCLTSSIGTYTAPWVQAFRLRAAGRVEGLQAWLDRGRKKVCLVSSCCISLLSSCGISCRGGSIPSTSPCTSPTLTRIFTSTDTAAGPDTRAFPDARDGAGDGAGREWGGDGAYCFHYDVLPTDLTETLPHRSSATTDSGRRSAPWTTVPGSRCGARRVGVDRWGCIRR